MRRTPFYPAARLGLCLTLLGTLVHCKSSDDAPRCTLAADAETPDYVQTLGCAEDFAALASEPLDSSLPGATSVKTVVDLEQAGALYFQNSEKYPIHHEFTSAHLSVAQGFSPVPDLQAFNETQYSSPDRRFLLGSLTHYSGPDVWAYEIATNDTASAAMIEQALDLIAANSFVGDKLVFHPTSATVEQVLDELRADIVVVDSETLYEGIDYQPLNYAESYGQLRFVTASALEEGAYVGFREIVVLDHVPNDLSVTAGIITAEFQTPLAHINVLSQNRGTPNMALRGAFDDEALRELDGQWVHLVVDRFDYTLEPVAQSEADSWWEEHKPTAVQVPGVNLEVTALQDIGDVLGVAADVDGDTLHQAIQEATRTFGGKAANYAALANVEGIDVPAAFAVPVHYYFQFMQDNGFEDRVSTLLARDDFQNDPAVRSAELEQLREDMQSAPVSEEFSAALLAKLAADFPAGQRMRFRSSTNAEDLDGFTGAGLYTSKSGDPSDPDYPVLDAIREVWSSVWFFRAFEERSYRSIDHLAVGMALLVHRSFPDEEANGVAITGNPYDRTGAAPAFYINVQYGEASVVLPGAGITTDQLLYYYLQTGQPTTYLSYSNLVPGGGTVLNREQVHALGEALEAIRRYFSPVYAPSDGSWWAMDVEFKFDAVDDEAPQLYIKQARPFGSR